MSLLTLPLPKVLTNCLKTQLIAENDLEKKREHHDKANSETEMAHDLTVA